MSSCPLKLLTCFRLKPLSAHHRFRIYRDRRQLQSVPLTRSRTNHLRRKQILRALPRMTSKPSTPTFKVSHNKGSPILQICKHFNLGCSLILLHQQIAFHNLKLSIKIINRRNHICKFLGNSQQDRATIRRLLGCQLNSQLHPRSHRKYPIVLRWLFQNYRTPTFLSSSH